MSEARFVAQGRFILQRQVENDDDIDEMRKRFQLGFIVGEINEYVVDAEHVAAKLVALLNEHWID